MTKLDAALDLAKRGYAVFPLAPNGKIPAIKNWQNEATTNPDTIRRWWTQRPDANIGTPTTGKCVIDVDPRNGGRESFEALQVIDPLPKTAVVETQGGGHHIYYALPPHTDVKGGTNKLGAGLDIKAGGGFVVAPGSTIDGRAYRWLTDRKPVAAPQWLIDACNTRKPRSEAAGARLVPEDDAAVRMAEQWLQDHAPEAIDGRRDDTAFKVAARFYDFGVSQATAHELLTEWNAVKAAPPLEPEDIARISESAGRNRDNPIGSKHPDAAGFEPVDPDRLRGATLVNVPAKRGLYYLTLDEGAGKALTHNAEPLIEGVIDCATMSVVYGESNSGKSFQEMDKDFHIAIGRPWAGRAVKQGAVVWVAAEGGAGVYKRLAALKEHYKPEKPVPFFVVPCPVNLLRADADVGPLITLIHAIEAAHACKVVKITLDTLSRVIAGGDENNSVDMGRLVHHFDAIREATAAHLTAIHHTGKDKAKGARGHSLLRAATDTEIEIDDRTATVTKQRDMEGDVVIRFRLTPIRVGTDVRGKEVTSCWVDTSEVAQVNVNLTRTEREVLSALAYALQNTTNKLFDWEFAAESWRKIGSAKVAARKTVGDHLGSLADKGWLVKPEDNQYFRTGRKLAEIGGFSQVMLAEFLGTLKSRESRQDHAKEIEALAEAEGLKT